MAENKTCPGCGAPLPPDAPAGVCPKCLLHAGLVNSGTDREELAEAPTLPPRSPADVSTVPPEESLVRIAAAEDGQQFGPYLIRGMLGQGGMGAVYDAEHVESGRQVALKVLNHRLESPDLRRRFLREGRLAASINHPNSVYIYGTEEIDDRPVISMELVPGGTLQDLVNRDGPLPVGEAVDLILQMIAGLKAAESEGVLHRDVKPSNCFLDADGTVKIGDFGLSISTSPRADTNLTQSGVFLGTPAFSSPEQLRGDELDVRSDIYAVGVTLFYLLTGRTPFEAEHMVQLLATVLEQPAPSPGSLRADVPQKLARVVQRCLAKQSKDRFNNYDELRQAILPYSSQAPDPGTLGFRVLAYGIDDCLLQLVAWLIPLLWFEDIVTWYLQFNAISDRGPQITSELNWLAVVGMLLEVAYFSIAEGIWGTTAGKAICRLRVVGQDRQAPRLPKTLLRSLILLASGWLPWWVMYGYDREAGIAAGQVEDLSLFWITASISLVAFLLLFSTVRRRNGYAGLHELCSGTRVVRRQATEQRPTLSLTDESLPDMHGVQQIGSYEILGRLPVDSTDEMLLAYDRRLLRKAWIRRTREGSLPPSPELRGLARIGRLRWLNGGDDGSGRWDAYEAPSGKPLLVLIDDEAQAWDAVRFWLSDLAEELSASLDNGPFPNALDLDRVWITGDGRAKLLDFPAPGFVDAERTPVETASVGRDAATVRVFLKQVAIVALEGRVLSPGLVQGREVSARIPLSARAFLNQLDGSENAAIPNVELKSLTRKPAAVSVERRAGALAACCLPILMIALFMIPTSIAEKQFITAHPEVGELSGFVEYYQTLGTWSSPTQGDPASIAELRDAVEIHVADRFRTTIEDDQIWSDPMAGGFIDSSGRTLLTGFLNAHPSPSSEEIARANALIEQHRFEIRELGWTVDYYREITNPKLLMAMLCVMLIVFVVLPSLVSVLILGESLLLRMLEIAVVTKDGERASRLRVLWRNTVMWSLVLLAMGLFIYFGGRLRPRALYPLIIYGLSTMFTAERGLQDRMAGTWLVPR